MRRPPEETRQALGNRGGGLLVERRVVDPTPALSVVARGKRIILVGVNFHPEPTGIGPYTTGLTDHLAASGAKVTVITGIPHYPAWRAEKGYRLSVRRRSMRDKTEVRRLRHFVPAKQNAVSRGLYEASFLLQASLTRLAGEQDLVIGVTPSLGGALAGSRLARRLKCPLLVIVQDLMAKAAGQSGIAGGGAVAGITATIEKKALSGAAAVGIVSESFRPSVESLGVPAERILPIANWSIDRTERQDRRLVRRRHGWGDDVLVAMHSGNMGNKQDLDNVVDAARLARNRRDILFVLMGDGSQRVALSRRADDLPNIAFLPPAPETEFADLLAAADVLLLNERATVKDMSLPSKLTSYFRSGRPVLAAVNADGAAARELRNAGAGSIVPPGCPSALVDALLQLQPAPKERRELGMSGRRYAAAMLSRARSMDQLESLLRLALAPDARTFA